MNKILRLLLLFETIFLFSCEVKNDPDQLKQKLDSLFTSENQAGRFDGTVAIGNRDSLFYEKAIGFADRVWDLPMQTNYRFDICSINKSFISTLVLQAIQEGKLKLSDQLTERLQNYTYTGSFHPDITIHQLLSHTSGLPDYGEIDPVLYKNNGRLFKRMHFTNKEYVEFISNVPPVNLPGKQFYYSNFAYHLLIIILEDLYQVPFAEILNQKILEPVGLKNTYSNFSNTEVFKNLVEAYNYNGHTQTWERNQFIDLSIGRRIFSTSSDLYKWGKEMNSNNLLMTEFTTKMQSNQLNDINDDFSYGYGWVVFDGEKNYRMGNLEIDRKYIIHGGSTEGYKSMLINIENGEYIIAFLANTGDQTNEMKLAKKIVNILMRFENKN